MRAAFSSTPIRAGTWCSLAARPRATARSMIPQHSSQVVFKMFAAPEMSVSLSTSMAKRSKARVKRLRGSAQGRCTWRTPSRRAVDPGRPGVEPGREPAGVEVAPGPLFGVVVERELDFALRAGPQPALVVRDDDVDSPVLDREVDVVDEPRVGQPEDLGVELDVTHRGLHPTGLRILPERHPQCRSLLEPSATDEPGVKGRAKPEREPERQRRLAATLDVG